MLVLNFSHPLPPDQITRLESLAGERVERVIEVKTQVDTQADLAPQVAALADACGLTPAQWQQEHIVILPPSLNSIAVTLLAELHGRMGYFPAHIRTRPVPGAPVPAFEVAELIDLQAVRDRARLAR
jgi:hypothetical protein